MQSSERRCINNRSDEKDMKRGEKGDGRGGGEPAIESNSPVVLGQGVEATDHLPPRVVPEEPRPAPQPRRPIPLPAGSSAAGGALLEDGLQVAEDVRFPGPLRDELLHPLTTKLVSAELLASSAVGAGVRGRREGKGVKGGGGWLTVWPCTAGRKGPLRPRTRCARPARRSRRSS